MMEPLVYRPTVHLKMFLILYTLVYSFQWSGQNIWNHLNIMQSGGALPAPIMTYAIKIRKSQAGNTVIHGIDVVLEYVRSHRCT